jgi:hypothetical protein
VVATKSGAIATNGIVHKNTVAEPLTGYSAETKNEFGYLA